MAYFRLFDEEGIFAYVRSQAVNHATGVRVCTPHVVVHIVQSLPVPLRRPVDMCGQSADVTCIDGSISHREMPLKLQIPMMWAQVMDRKIRIIAVDSCSCGFWGVMSP